LRKIVVSGTGAARALAEHLRDGFAGLGTEVEVLCENEPLTGPPADLAVFVTEEPLEVLDPRTRAAARGAEVVLVELGGSFEAGAVHGLEAALKDETGARKVLIFEDGPGRDRAFGKVLDIALSRIGGGRMPEEIPQEVVEAVRKEAAEGRIPCARAQELAGVLGVPIPVVGRALDLLDIKIIHCQLGCF
jgi:hypothetical protein